MKRYLRRRARQICDLKKKSRLWAIPRVQILVTPFFFGARGIFVYMLGRRSLHWGVTL